MKSVLLRFLSLILLLNSCKDDNSIVKPPDDFKPEPTVSIISPTEGTNITSSQDITVEANDDKGIVKVQLFIDNLTDTNKTFTTKPYKYFWNISALADSTHHTIFAKAYDADSNVTSSKVVDVIVYKFQPTNLSAIMLSDTLVELRWNDNSAFESSFLIEQSVDNTTYNFVKEVSANTTHATLTGNFEIDKFYYFRIKARKDTIYSNYSNVAQVKIIIEVPSNLSVQFSSDTSADLNWEDNSTVEDSYEVELSIDNVNFSLIKSVTANTIGTSINYNFYTSNNYYFRIRGIKGNHHSEYSNVAQSKVILENPSNLVISHISKSEIQLKWDDNSSFEKGYSLEEKIDDGNYYEIKKIGANSDNTSVNNLDTAKTYSFRVKAYTNLNLSEYSNIVETQYLINLKDYSLKRDIQFAETYNAEVVKFSPDGNLLAAAADIAYHTVRIFDTNSGNQTVSFSGSSDNVYRFAFIDNNEIVVNKVESDYGTLVYKFKIYDARSGNFIRNICSYDGKQIFPMEVSPDGKFLAVGFRSLTSGLKIWRISDGSLRNEIDAHTNTLLGLCFNSNGQLLASSSVDKLAKIWNTSDASLLQTLSGHTSSVQDVSFSPDNIMLITSGGYDNSARIWNVYNGNLMKSIHYIDGPVMEARFNSNNNAVFVSSGKVIKVFRVKDGALLGEITGHTGSIRAMDINYRKNLLVSSAYDNKLKLWETNFYYEWTKSN